MRDGFVGGVGVVPGLYDVTATVSSKVIRATIGQLVFSYDFGALDLSGTGTNGVLGFDLTGFAGYDVTFAFQTADAFFYALQINRSADGDTISFDFFDPTDLLGAGFETFLFAVNAPSYRTNGAGTAAILLDTFGTEDVALTGFLPVPAQVPLPASLPALLIGLGALGALRTRNRRRNDAASLDSAPPRA